MVSIYNGTSWSGGKGVAKDRFACPFDSNVSLPYVGNKNGNAAKGGGAVGICSCLMLALAGTQLGIF